MWELLIWKLKFWIRNSSTDAEALAFGMPYWHHADIPAFCPIGDGLPIGSHRSDCGNWLVPEFLECHHASHPVIILCLENRCAKWTAGGLVFEISGKFRYDAEAAQDPAASGQTRMSPLNSDQVNMWAANIDEKNSSARKMLKRERDWRIGFSIGRQYFFPRGKCRITVLGRIMTLPKWSFMEWQRTSRVVLFCISFAISESFVGKVATGHECWRRWQDQERQHQGPNIQCFLHHVHVVLICLPGGLRARKASWWQVWNGMNMYFFHVFNRQNAPYVLLFECFPLVYEATRIGASTLEVPEVQQLMAQRLCGDVS